MVQTIADEREFDFGMLKQSTLDEADEGKQGEAIFWPRWYAFPYHQDFYLVKAHQTVRYHLRPVGENFYCTESTVVEVAWDGLYTEDLNELAKHLKIRVVPKEKPAAKG